ncbi:MAG: BolA family protein [Sulfuricellaceae bacterium]|jgi:BolA protein
MNRIEAIRDRLAALAPLRLDIEDDSAKHAGHKSAGGGGHFRLTIVSDAFAGKSLVQRHRLVYDALDDLLKQNEIHALSIKAYTEQEI